MHLVYCVYWRVQSGLCSLMRRFYLEGPKSVFLCSLMHLVCCVCRRVPTPMCSLMHHVFLCLSGLAQILFLCSPMHHVFCVCLKGPIWYVLTNAPLLFGGARIFFLCSLMHLVCCVCRRVPTPICSLMHHIFCVFLDWPKVCFCAHQCTADISIHDALTSCTQIIQLI